MGNSISMGPHEQNNCEICMKCNSNNILNTDLMLLNIMVPHSQHERKEILLRCSKGHILLYEGNNAHIDTYIKILKNKQKSTQESKSEIDELKNEISLLKEELKIIKNGIEPSAPPLLNIELVEAELIE
jgi:hypothetical protein